MNIIIKNSGDNRSEITTSRPVIIILSSGDRFELSEDIEGFMTVSKVDIGGNEGSRLHINPRYSNEITVH